MKKNCYRCHFAVETLLRYIVRPGVIEDICPECYSASQRRSVKKYTPQFIANGKSVQIS